MSEATGSQTRGPDLLLVLGSIMSIQVGAALVTGLFDDIGAAGAALVRLALAALVLQIAIRPRRRKTSPGDRRALIAYGLALGLMNLSFYLGIDRVPLGTAVAIEFLGPLTVAAILARRPRDRWWVALAAIGVLALTEPWSAAGADLVGVAWLLLAATCWGVYIPLAARAARDRPGLEPVAIAMTIGVVVALVPGLVQAGSDLLTLHVLAIGAVAAIAGSVIPYSLEQLALRRIPAGVFGVLMALEPAVAAVVGLLILDQQPKLIGVVGMAAVIVAGVGVTRASRAPAVPVAS